MTKDFVTVTPESGSDNGSLRVVTDLNFNLSNSTISRQTAISVAWGGISKSIKVHQNPLERFFLFYGKLCKLDRCTKLNDFIFEIESTFIKSFTNNIASIPFFMRFTNDMLPISINGNYVVDIVNNIINGQSNIVTIPLDKVKMQCSNYGIYTNLRITQSDPVFDNTITVLFSETNIDKTCIRFVDKSGSKQSFSINLVKPKNQN